MDNKVADLCKQIIAHNMGIEARVDLRGSVYFTKNWARFSITIDNKTSGRVIFEKFAHLGFSEILLPKKSVLLAKKETMAETYAFVISDSGEIQVVLNIPDKNQLTDRAFMYDCVTEGLEYLEAISALYKLKLKTFYANLPWYTKISRYIKVVPRLIAQYLLLATYYLVLFLLIKIARVMDAPLKWLEKQKSIFTSLGDK